MTVYPSAHTYERSNILTFVLTSSVAMSATPTAVLQTIFSVANENGTAGRPERRRKEEKKGKEGNEVRK